VLWCMVVYKQRPYEKKKNKKNTQKHLPGTIGISHNDALDVPTTIFVCFSIRSHDDGISLFSSLRLLRGKRRRTRKQSSTAYLGRIRDFLYTVCARLLLTVKMSK
jgi:hypothetical protein